MKHGRGYSQATAVRLGLSLVNSQAIATSELGPVQVVSVLPSALYSIYCLGVSTILESEKIITMWPTNDLIALTRKGSRGVGAQTTLFNKQNVKI